MLSLTVFSLQPMDVAVEPNEEFLRGVFETYGKILDVVVRDYQTYPVSITS